MNITTKFQTVATYGYTGSVSRDENRRAHGGVCFIQARRGKNGILVRKVNANGVAREVGKSFAPTAEQIRNWGIDA